MKARQTNASAAGLSAMGLAAAAVLGASPCGAVTKLNADPQVAQALTPNAHVVSETQTVAHRMEALASRLPEPADWALMIIGFGGAGAALRVRRRKLAGS